MKALRRGVIIRRHLFGVGVKQEALCVLTVQNRKAIGEALGSLGAELEARLCPDRARSWFVKAAITDVVGETLTLELRDNFFVDRVGQDMGNRLACLLLSLSAEH